MTYARPTPVTFFRAVKLCLLLLFAPKKFLEHQVADNALLKEQDKDATLEPGALVVRRALFEAALLVAASGVVGYLGGVMLGSLSSCANPKVVMWLQIVSACLLLWGTLFIRGWEIQTHGGHTLTERVNQWIYRALYCVGTSVIVFSVAWPACATQG